MKVNDSIKPQQLRYELAGYLRGKGILWGMGEEVYPGKAMSGGTCGIHIEPSKVTGLPYRPSGLADSLGMFTDGQWEFVVLGAKAPEALFAEARNKLKPGGYLCTTNTAVTPPGAWAEKTINPAVRVFKKLSGYGKIKPPATPNPTERTACVARYGAIGDMIMVTPLIRALAHDGYKVTINATPYSTSVLTNNPYVNNVIHQEREVIPNEELGGYWDLWKSRYDKYINLSESIEGGLLKLEGRLEFYTTKAWRHQQCNVNYQEATLRIGGYTHESPLPEIFISPAEQALAQARRKSMGKTPVIMWAIKGSSHHKAHALFQKIIVDLVDSKLCQVIICGQQGEEEFGFEYPGVVSLIGKTSIRETMALIPEVQCVVGPESFLVNAASAFNTPKVVFLSHSTEENLTKHWKNCTSLAPAVQCHPCHQLHYTMESCPIVEAVGQKNEILAAGPACTMGAITPESIIAAVNRYIC